LGLARKKEKEEGENCIKKNFGVFSHNTRSDKGACNGQVCDTYWRKKEMHTQFLSESLKEREHIQDLGVEGT
jgi:hypothetical protein